MEMFLIITSCSASKCDSIPILKGSKIVEPPYYLDAPDLISKLNSIREYIFRDSRVDVGTKVTYAFDLYVNAGNAYKDLKKNSYQKLKSILLSTNEIEWFFLSGGYGIIHALERAKKYQATFNRNIANKNNIRFTADLWKDVLPLICDSVVFKFNPEWIYVFGSKDYTNFIKQAQFWKSRKNVKMFESTGQNGPRWLSPKLNELVNSIINKSFNEFNEKYPKFVKQDFGEKNEWLS